MSIISFHQRFLQSLPKCYSIDKIFYPCPTLYSRKYVSQLNSSSIPAQPTRKDYLPQETAQRSLRCHFRQLTSHFIVRPRMQLIDSRNICSQQSNLLKNALNVPASQLIPENLNAGFGWVTPFYTHQFQSLIRSHFARSLPHLCRITIYGIEKARSGLVTGELARVCFPPSLCLTGPEAIP